MLWLRLVIAGWALLACLAGIILCVWMIRDMDRVMAQAKRDRELIAKIERELEDLESKGGIWAR